MSITVNGNIFNSNIAENINNSKIEIYNTIDLNKIKELIPKLQTEISSGNYDEKFRAEIIEKINNLQNSVDANDCSSSSNIIQNIITGTIASGLWTVGSALFQLLSPFA